MFCDQSPFKVGNKTAKKCIKLYFINMFGNQYLKVMELKLIRNKNIDISKKMMEALTIVILDVSSLPSGITCNNFENLW